MKMKTMILTGMVAMLATSAFAGQPKFVLSPDEYVDGFETKAGLDASQKAFDELAEFLKTDPEGLSNDPVKKAALEKAHKDADNVALYVVAPNTRLKVLKVVKSTDPDKYFDDYLVNDANFPGRNEWVSGNDVLGMDGMALPE